MGAGVFSARTLPPSSGKHSGDTTPMLAWERKTQRQGGGQGEAWKTTGGRAGRRRDTGNSQSSEP